MPVREARYLKVKQSSGWKRPPGRNLGEHRQGTALWQHVQRYRHQVHRFFSCPRMRSPLPRGLWLLATWRTAVLFYTGLHNVFFRLITDGKIQNNQMLWTICHRDLCYCQEKNVQSSRPTASRAVRPTTVWSNDVSQNLRNRKHIWQHVIQVGAEPLSQKLLRRKEVHCFQR